MITMFLSLAASAQGSAPEMADTFRQEGKIYVVISVIALIFIGLVGFMIYLERKVKRLENKIGKKDRV